MKVLDLIEHMPALRHLLACTRWTGNQWCPDFLVNRMAWCDGCRAREIELPKLLDELHTKVTALEGGIVAENIRTNAVIGETNALLKEYQIEGDETLRDVVERLTSALKRTMSERDECMRKLSIAYTRDADAIAVLQTALGVQPRWCSGWSAHEKRKPHEHSLGHLLPHLQRGCRLPHQPRRDAVARAADSPEGVGQLRHSLVLRNEYGVFNDECGKPVRCPQVQPEDAAHWSV